MHEILGNKKLSDVDDFRGLTACMGKARGQVRIVHSAREVNKVEQGDILVAVMTRPDYVPAMKKAAAIITDEGGLTCHAAIISRELNIPCIIGTKIATKVLKDGMEVEVNANHSWVKIIKKI
jgi:pyruvate,water dikinase